MEKSDFKVGQKIAINNRHGIPYIIKEITKVTETQITVDNKTKFIIRTGAEFGTSGHFYGQTLARDPQNYHQLISIDKAEETNREWHIQLTKKDLVYKLHQVDLNKLSDADFLTVKNILSKYERKES